MANRPHGYGLTGEVQRKIKGKYSEELELQARDWLAAVLDGQINGYNIQEGIGMDDLHAKLKDGVILCRLMNVLRPGAVKKINETKMAFKMMENIAKFLDAATDYGVQKADLFQTVDLYEKQNMVQVVNGIHALGRRAQSVGCSVPALGPREAAHNPRNFDDEKLRAGQTVIGLQYGSNAGASQKGLNFGKTRSIVD